MDRPSLKSVAQRVYADFLLPSRLNDYALLLDTALACGYRILPIVVYWRELAEGVSPDQSRILLLRHDVDTDVGTAKRFWEIERARGINSSYYFRLSTMDYRLMRGITLAGGEASYHYEELATVAKRLRLRDPAQVAAAMPAIRAEFSHNLRHLRQQIGLPMTVVASHGDFANRRLGLSNWALLTPALREELGIELEVYDKALSRRITNRHTDAPYPRFWAYGDPLVSLRAGAPVVHLLVHPRQWRANPVRNLAADVHRLAEGLAYGWGRRTSAATKDLEGSNPGSSI